MKNKIVLNNTNDYVNNENTKIWRDLSNERTGVYQGVIQILKKINFFNDADTIIDIGCGPGHFLKLIRKNYKDINLVGLDISSVMINQAKLLKIPNCKFNIKDITSNDFHEKEVSRIICYTSLYLWNDKKKGLQNLLKLINKNGLAFFVHPNKDYNFNELEKKMFPESQLNVLNYAISNGFTDFTLSQLYKSIGIENYKISYSGKFQEDLAKRERFRNIAPFFYSLIKK